MSIVGKCASLRVFLGLYRDSLPICLYVIRKLSNTFVFTPFRTTKLNTLSDQYCYSELLLHVSFVRIYLLTYLSTFLLTYLLTLRSRVLLEKLTGLQLVKIFPAFYGTRMFITAVASARHLSLSWASSIQSTPPHPNSWWSIYPPIYAWVSQMVSILQFSRPKSCIHLYPPPYALDAPPISFFSILSSELQCMWCTDH